MKKRLSKDGIFHYISTAAVFTALITISIIQYRWVTSSAENDITELYRSLTYTIYSTISQEFSNLPLFQREKLNSMENIDEKNVREELKNILEDFDNNSDLEYILSASYIDYPQLKNLYLLSEGKWDRVEYNNIPVDIINMERESRRPGLREMSLIADSEDRGKIWLILPANKSGELLMLFHFDIKLFFEQRVKESLQLIMNNYELKWIYELSEDESSINEKRYQYSPYRALKNSFSAKESSLLIQIPYEIMLFPNRTDNGPKSTHFPLPLIRDNRRENNASIYVDILVEGKSLIQEKEYHLTLRWLITLVLMIGIGVAYILILYQITKLKQFRFREKEFVASVTHELRTPLTVIHSAADNIKSGIISQEKIEQYGQLITDQSSRLSSMIEGILLFSRLEGKSEQSPIVKKVDFIEIEKDLNIFVQSIKEDSRKNIQIDFGLLPDSVMADKDSIELILTNLLANSMKHAYEKDNESEVRITGYVKLPNSLIFTVEDDGSGIEKSEKNHIFEPFFRGSKSVNDQIKGSGLGLYLSYRKAHLLGGTLLVESPYERADGRMRKGTRFILKIPFNPLNKESGK
jgi:signal transduction histidine kinase